MAEIVYYINAATDPDFFLTSSWPSAFVAHRANNGYLNWTFSRPKSPSESVVISASITYQELNIFWLRKVICQVYHHSVRVWKVILIAFACLKSSKMPLKAYLELTNNASISCINPGTRRWPRRPLPFQININLYFSFATSFGFEFCQQNLSTKMWALKWQINLSGTPHCYWDIHDFTVPILIYRALIESYQKF